MDNSRSPESTTDLDRELVKRPSAFSLLSACNIRPPESISAMNLEERVGSNTSIDVWSVDSVTELEQLFIEKSAELGDLWRDTARTVEAVKSNI